MSEIVTSGIAYESSQGVIVRTTRPAIDHLSDEVEVVWRDSRHRSLDQNRKAWALMSEIAEYQGQSSEDVYREQSTAFSLKHLELLHGELFHLSTASMSEARAFINLLIEIIVEYGIPTKEPLYDMCEDISRYVYVCLTNKKCAVCGKKAELHHVDHVGMGYNRHEINHIGMRCLPLCSDHHKQAHTIGQLQFDKLYHLEPVTIDQRIAKKYNLKGDTQ